MSTSDTQGESTSSDLDVGSTAERAHRTSRTFRSVYSFAGGMAPGLLPLFLYLLNHLTLSSSLFPFHPSLTFCKPQVWMPYENIGMLDKVAYILYAIVACLGVPALVGIGKVFHWRKNTITLCVFGLVLTVVFVLFFFYVFLLPLALHQCFHLVGER